MKRYLFLTIGAILLATAALLFHRSFAASRDGLFSRNNCGTLDRFIMWDGGVNHAPRAIGFYFAVGIPNGVTGRDPNACKDLTFNGTTWEPLK